MSVRDLVEASPVQPVAVGDRRSWVFLASIQVGITISVPLFILGGALGQGLSFSDLVPAILLGSTVVAILATCAGLVGVQARVPTAILVRDTFGPTGARLVAAVLVCNLFGWFGVQAEMLARSLHELLASVFGLVVPTALLAVAAGLLMTTTAAIGAKILGKIAYAVVPLLLLVIAVPLVRGFTVTPHPWAAILAPHGHAYTAAGVTSIVVGAYMGGVATAPDLARFMRTRRDLLAGVWVSIGGLYPILLTVAALLALLYHSGDLVTVLINAGVKIPALAVLVLATWTSNDKNLYEASLSLSALLPRIQRWKLTAAAGLIGTVLAMLGIFEYFISILVIAGIVIAPVTGVYVSDFMTRRTGRRVAATAHGSAIAAWCAGLVAGLATLPAPEHGLGWLHATGIPTLDAFLAGAILYALLLVARPAPSVRPI